MTHTEEIARLTDSEPAFVAPVAPETPPRLICAWCPDFDPMAVRHASHGMCASCQARMRALNPTTRGQVK